MQNTQKNNNLVIQFINHAVSKTLTAAQESRKHKAAFQEEARACRWETQNNGDWNIRPKIDQTNDNCSTWMRGRRHTVCRLVEWGVESGWAGKAFDRQLHIRGGFKPHHMGDLNNYKKLYKPARVTPAVDLWFATDWQPLEGETKNEYFSLTKCRGTSSRMKPFIIVSWGEEETMAALD